MDLSRNGARALRATCLLLSLFFALPASQAGAEGFAIMENSARGMGVAGGLIARGGDASTVAYNPAAMTRLGGTQAQANLAVTQMYWGIDTPRGNTHNSHQTWPIPAFYLTHQINDDFWFGIGSFTRFGLGVKYPGNWPGGANLQAVQLITSSITPNIAYRINDVVSVAAGVEVMGASMQMRKNIPNPYTGKIGALGDVNINGHGVSFGGNLALHVQPNEQWALGLAYRAPMSLKVSGKARWDNPRAGRGYASNRLRGTMHLPDSIGVGVAYKPLVNLSLEADAVYTLWSRFSDFNMYMKTNPGYWQNSDRDWKNSWTFSLSAEYMPVDWMALRLGFMYETSPMNVGNADYMLPSNGRNYYTAGLGFFWGKWTLDLAYMYIRNRVLSYTEAAAKPAPDDHGVVAGSSTHPHAHNFGIGIGYRF